MSQARHLEKGLELYERAIKADESERLDEAQTYYDRVADKFIACFQTETPDMVKKLRKKVDELKTRAGEIYTQTGQESVNRTRGDAPTKKEETARDRASATRITTRPDIKFKDVAGLDAAKAALLNALVRYSLSSRAVIPTLERR